MTRPRWTLPIEAIRGGATIVSAAHLAKLASAGARFQPHVTVELSPAGFVATLFYRLPDAPNRVHQTHVSMSWWPAENAISPATPPPVPQGQAAPSQGTRA